MPPVFLVLLLIVLLIFLAVLVATVSVLALIVGGVKATVVRSVDKRRERTRQLTAIAQAAETSLLRAGDMPEPSSADLLRAAHRADETQKDEMLRIVEK